MVSKINLFGQPFSTKKCQKDDVSQPCEVRGNPAPNDPPKPVFTNKILNVWPIRDCALVDFASFWSFCAPISQPKPRGGARRGRRLTVSPGSCNVLPRPRISSPGILRVLDPCQARRGFKPSLPPWTPRAFRRVDARSSYVRPSGLNFFDFPDFGRIFYRPRNLLNFGSPSPNIPKSQKSDLWMFLAPMF